MEARVDGGNAEVRLERVEGCSSEPRVEVGVGVAREDLASTEACASARTPACASVRVHVRAAGATIAATAEGLRVARLTAEPAVAAVFSVGPAAAGPGAAALCSLHLASPWLAGQ